MKASARRVMQLTSSGMPPGPLAAVNTRKAIEICKNNPKWKLSIQTHKLLQIP